MGWVLFCYDDFFRDILPSTTECETIHSAPTSIQMIGMVGLWTGRDDKLVDKLACHVVDFDVNRCGG